MNHLLRHPIFYSVLLALSLAALAVAWSLRRCLREAQAHQQKLGRVRDELLDALAEEISPNPAEWEQNEREVESATQVVTAHEAALIGLNSRRAGETMLPGTEGPTNSTDAYFDLAVFTERMRTRAQQTGVTLKPNERFGFAEYASRGPTKESVASVFRQRLLAEHLLEHLFEAGPSELLSVQRGLPLEEEKSGEYGRSASRNRITNDVSADYFDLERQFSARIPGAVETKGFRVSFQGGTETLRVLVDRLAISKVACSIRTVRAAPRTHAEQGRAGRETAGGTRLLVQPNEMLFTLTVEFLEFIKPVQPGS